MAEGTSGLQPTFYLLSNTTCTGTESKPVMALNLETIRATAERVAASHSLDVVDIEFQGAGKFRALRVFVEKNAA